MIMKKYEFYCSFCNKNRITYIPESEFLRITCRNVGIEELLPENKFHRTYINIFQFGICSVCQANMLDNFAGGMDCYDCSEDADDSVVESNVANMWEIAMRS